jgi:hypothetical protein
LLHERELARVRAGVNRHGFPQGGLQPAAHPLVRCRPSRGLAARNVSPEGACFFTALGDGHIASDKEVAYTGAETVFILFEAPAAGNDWTPEHLTYSYILQQGGVYKIANFSFVSDLDDLLQNQAFFDTRILKSASTKSPR